MSLSKITENELTGKGVIPLDDIPGLSAEAMKAKFEEIVRSVVIPKFNDTIDQLNEMLFPDDPSAGSILTSGLVLHTLAEVLENEDEAKLPSAETIKELDETIPYVPAYNANFGDHQYGVLQSTDADYANLSDGSIGFVNKAYPVPNDESAETVTPASVTEVKPKGWKGYENYSVVNESGLTFADGVKTAVSNFYLRPSDDSRTGCVLSIIGMLGFNLALTGASGSITVSIEDNGVSKFSMTQDYESSGNKIVSISCGVDVATSGNHVITVYATVSGGSATM